MYLRPSTKWNEYLLAEAIENIGLPSRVVSYLKTRARFTITGDRRARSYAERRGIELTPLTDRDAHVVPGLLVKGEFPMMLFNREDGSSTSRTTLKKKCKLRTRRAIEKLVAQRMIDANSTPPGGSPQDMLRRYSIKHWPI